jgi:diol dehydratase reactivase alpha subunit
MAYVVGVDVGNSSTEASLARDDGDEATFLASSIVETTGIKGTTDNVPGAVDAVTRAVESAGLSLSDVDRALVNEAAPVIGDIAMETITETVVTESTMIGHDPSTPSGSGLGVGVCVDLVDLAAGYPTDDPLVVLVDETVPFDVAADAIDELCENGADVRAAVVQADDAVVIQNHIDVDVPIVDEVGEMDAIPRGQPMAVEVAPPGSGRSIEKLSNAYDIATIFDLDAEQTEKMLPVARALSGNRSAVVVKTPEGDVEKRSIPAGELVVTGERGTTTSVDVVAGADEIMSAIVERWPLADVAGERGTNVGGMFHRVRSTMAEITGKEPSSVRVRDVLAVDTVVPQDVRGATAGEYRMENAVGLAAMVRTDELPMQQVADGIAAEICAPVQVHGVEAKMAALGSLTTPGTDRPITILDIGGGSTDAAYLDEDLAVDSVHLAGAGDMVTRLIASELDVEDHDLAERVKRNPVARVETLFSLRHEDGTMNYLDEAVDAESFGRVVVLDEDGSFEPVPVDVTVEEVRDVRRQAKRDVFVGNARRALSLLSPTGEVGGLPSVVLIGRSALDFEIPELVTEALSEDGIYCGRGNVRGEWGARQAVATGLVLSTVGSGDHLDFDVPPEFGTTGRKLRIGDETP